MYINLYILISLYTCIEENTASEDSESISSIDSVWFLNYLSFKEGHLSAQRTFLLISTPCPIVTAATLEEL